MSTDQATIEFLLDQLDGPGVRFTTKRMFGEYCVYRDGHPVAFVCDDVLFIKDTPAGREAIGVVATPEFGPPYPGAKLYLRLAADAWDDGDWLRRVLDATAEALPAPKPRRAPGAGGASARSRGKNASQASPGRNAKAAKTTQPRPSRTDASSATPPRAPRKPK